MSLPLPHQRGSGSFPVKTTCPKRSIGKSSRFGTSKSGRDAKYSTSRASSRSYTASISLSHFGPKAKLADTANPSSHKWTTPSKRHGRVIGEIVILHPCCGHVLRKNCKSILSYESLRFALCMSRVPSKLRPKQMRPEFRANQSCHFPCTSVPLVVAKQR